jgi:tetratricopeptide (TPR) repeat protein
LDVAERAERPHAILQCRRHRAALFLDSGAGAALDEEIEHFARESAAAGCKQHYVAAFRAMRAIVRGRFEEGRRAIDEAQNLADPLSPEEYRFTPTGQRVLLPAEYRDTEALARCIADLLHDYPRVTTWYGSQATVALALGRTEVARASLERLAANDFALVPRDHTYVITLATVALTSWRLGERQHARRLYELLLPHASAQASAGFGIVYFGPVDWFLGVLATMLGRRRDAARHFRVALATTRRLGAWPWHARTELAYTELLATGAAAEERRAHALAASAADAATRLGMNTLRGEAERLIAKLGRMRRGVAR